MARLVLAAPRANILDRRMMSELEAHCRELARRRDLHAIVVTAEGPHFSFGASVAEHLPGEIESTLESLGSLLRAILELPAPTLAAVRGQCLGGAFELALACDLILAEEGAQLGCPEIRLAVFPPAAAALLPVRIGAGPAAELLLTGRSWSGAEAARRGLVTRVAGDGHLDREVDAWLDAAFLQLSPGALRHAVVAARDPLRRALEAELPRYERLYREELMAEPDALEGLEAFLEKRPPRWQKTQAER